MEECDECYFELDKIDGVLDTKGIAIIDDSFQVSFVSFPEFLGMLTNEPGQYCTPLVYDSEGFAQFWVGMYRPLDG